MTANDRQIAQAITEWFAAAARDLPWRATAQNGWRDPYRSLVSEFMLQQTQVARVLEHFEPFLDRFPTVGDLARADEQSVLAQWSGLGYYRRARALHAAARAIVDRHDGVVPSDVESLRALPGIGPYTAGAIASMVFNKPEPIVDGNVVRVVLRLEGRDLQAASREAGKLAWLRARELVKAAGNPGALNEGLMELGATVCTPRSPKCEVCPIAAHCIARCEGRQAEIPAPRETKKRGTVHHTLLLLEDSAGRALLVRRPEQGLWAGMWCPPSIERDDRQATPQEIASWAGIDEDPAPIASFTHQTTHLEVKLQVFRATLARGPGPRWGRFVSRDEATSLALSNAHRKALDSWLTNEPSLFDAEPPMV
jgi:A/G-specific adenine glycosylase